MELNDGPLWSLSMPNLWRVTYDCLLENASPYTCVRTRSYLYTESLARASSLLTAYFTQRPKPSKVLEAYRVTPPFLWPLRHQKWFRIQHIAHEIITWHGI